MLVHLLIVGLLLQAESNSAPIEPVPSHAQPGADLKTGAEPVFLVNIKRIYVDSFGDDIISKELQSMIVSSLVATKRFKVTENREKADAILKGVALEKSSQELHAYGEGTSVGGASGGGHSEINGSGGTVSGSSGGGFIARHMGISDSSIHTETINEARIAVRLVNADGDVIWTSTQESKGAKFKGSSADVADRCVKQLLRDVEKLEGSTAMPSTSIPAATQPQPK
jgi:curli biogenesis system outer membrane secretion channel CsgG